MGSAAGNDELFLFVKKVDRSNELEAVLDRYPSYSDYLFVVEIGNIKVRFYEQNNNGDVIWQGWGSFKEDDVHYQHAIALKTPPYHNVNIKENVN